MSEFIVEVNHLSRRYGRTLALDDVSFAAGKGRVYGLVGANGAGKTTLIKHIIGLLRCKSGSVKVFGRNPVQDPVSVLRNTGYLSEDRDLPEWMTINELMDYTQAYYPNWDTNYARELLDTFGLDSGQQIKNLSRGMRAQAALIAAIAHRPQLLIFDEPSSGLDAVVRKDILNAVVRTLSEEGRTVIFSSHFLDEVERMSDHVTMIHEGRIALDGRLESLTDTHHVTSIRFAEAPSSAPRFAETLSCDGSGRLWKLLHTSSLEQVGVSVKQIQGEIIESRNANLEEIFVARVGRGKAEAAAA